VLGWGAGREVREAVSGRTVGVGADGLALQIGAREVLLLTD
jgi:hypothetical protein